MSLLSIADWLDKYQTNGVDISLSELIQYRASAHLLNLSPRGKVMASLAGGERSSLKGRGMEFDEARHYQAGDDIRAIDWRVTARTGKTHTKIYREERERPVFMFVDFTHSMKFGTQFLYKSVQASHLAALLAWNAVNRGDKIGGLVFTDESHYEHKPKAQGKSALMLLNKLTELHQKTDNKPTDEAAAMQFYNACMRLAHVAKPGSLVYLISDFQYLDEQTTALLSRVARRCDVRAVLISDPLEHYLPHTSVAQQVSVTDGEDVQVIGLGSVETETQYAAHQGAHFERIQHQLKTYKIPTYLVDAAKPLDTQIYANQVGQQL